MEHIRSYACRSTKRFTKGQARSIFLYSEKWIIPYQSSPLNLSELFPRSQRFVLEIGFGSGDATYQIAKEHADIGYLGVEVYRPGIAKLLMQIEKNQLYNIFIIQEDVIRVLKDMLPQGSFAGVHIFFPDPWHKRRHRKRRLIKASFVHDLALCLKTGGYLHIVTDCEDYSKAILDIVESETLFCNEDKGFDSVKTLRPKTYFEMRGIREHREIHEIHVMRI